MALVATVALALMLFASASASGQGTATPDQVGQWSAPVDWPLVAVHMSLEPTGQVFALDGFAAAPNSERLWDPASGNFVPVPYGRNLFCAGHIQLADGRTLIVGGHINADDGLADTTIFNPSNNTYFRGPDMTVGRWYPTVTQLPDGRVFTMAGDNIVQDRPGTPPPFADASVDSLPEVYNPRTNTWIDLTGAKLTSPLYPFLFVLSDGKIFNAGPDTVTRTIDPKTWQWTTVGTSPFDGMSAVMYRPNKIMKAGTWADPDFKGALTYNANARTAVIDMSAGTPAWRETAPMAFSRAYQNLTLLPDGTVMASGGMTTSDGVDISKAVLPAEIWNPDTETWTTVASLQNGREYHSTALLLPDGRVLMAGGGQLPGSSAVNQTNAEIYSPPYLFKGARPSITAAPSSVNYGANFDVTTPDAASVAKVSLIRLPSVTHALDMNQRFQFLNFTTGSGKVTATAPGNANLAPPGDYMLFILNGTNVPSVAKIIHVNQPTDSTAPTVSITAPGAGSVSGTVNVTANATDDTSVESVQFKLDGANLGPAQYGAPSSFAWDTTQQPNGAHTLTAVAIDPAGNATTSANVNVTVDNGGGPPASLVAAYSFDQGSGTTVPDLSGKGNNGTISNATWTTNGKFGSALSFNGTNALVSIPDSSTLDLTTGMTLEAWVNPTTLGTNVWRTAIFKAQPNNYVYALYGHTGTNVPSADAIVGGVDHDQRGTGALPLNTWTHLAATYDGSSLRLFVNGTQVATQAATGAITTSTGVVTIGGNNVWPEWFAGLIDEVRIYNVALTASSIQADMATSVGSPDTQAPTAPTGFTATGSISSVALSWTASTDNVGVANYDVYRSTTSGFTPSTANRIAQPTGTGYTDTGLGAGTYYYKVQAEDAAGNLSPSSTEKSAAVTGDVTPPTAPTGLSAVGGSGQAALSWTASTDNVGVVKYDVYRSTTSGFTPSTANRIAQPTATSYTDTGLAAGTYYYKVAAEDAPGNLSGPSNQASAVVTQAAPAGLVAAYSFDQGSGTSLPDLSGNGNNGTISGATWTTSGKFGSALSFNGVSNIVNVADSTSLDLTSAMTLEAWVNPTALGSQWRTAILKEQSNNYVYGLYAGTGTIVPSGNVIAGGVDHDQRGTSQLALNTWTHIATTYDGTTLRLYVNGTQVASQAATGAITTSTGSLRIGGNNLWGEYFAGTIDEIRIYNRALSAAEVSTDMNKAVGVQDTQPPTAPSNLVANGSISSVSLSWTASTDNIGVSKYNVYRGTTAGFTPSVGNRIAQPTGTTYNDTGLAAGTYYYKVIAEDAVGNVSPASNEANAAVTGDVSPPTAPSNLVATGGISSISLTWTGSTDNVGVTKYDVYRSTTAGFTPGTGNRIAQPAGTTYNDTGLAAGTYYYKVQAEDAALNLSPASNEANAAATGDVSPPTAPTNLVATGGANQVSLTWTGSTDNVGVTKYDVYRSATSGFTPGPTNRIAQPTATSYTDSGLAAGTYYYKVQAEDAALNLSAASNQASGTATSAPPAGVVAAYSFDAGSGTTLADLSGNGNNGTISGATWTTSGKYGSALSFNGTASIVNIPDSNSLDLTSAMTLEAWVNPTALGNGNNAWRTVALKEATNNYAYALYANTGTGRPSANAVTGGVDHDLRGAGQIALNAWTHLAATYDGSTLKLYVNGALVTTAAATGLITTSTGALRLGGNTLWGEYFAGLIDEVRIYSRALSATEIQTDMNQSVGTPDTQAPTAPTNLAANAGISSVSLSWTGSTDNVGVAKYDVYRGTSAGFTPAPGNLIAQPTSNNYTDAGRPAGTYYYKVAAEDFSSNVSGPSNEVSAVVTGDISPPTTPTGLTATGGSGQAVLNWTGSTDNVGVTKYDVYRSTVTGFTPGPTNRIAQPAGSPYTDSGLGAGTYYYKVQAEDASGNLSGVSNEASAVVATPPPVGLVGAYAFDENTGTVTADSSGKGNNGTAAGTTWTIGKFGDALSFNGTSSLVTVADSATLDLTGGMTVEAWLYPTALGTGLWRTVAMKENGANYAWALYANTGTNVPSGNGVIGGTDHDRRGTSQLPLNTWSHLATTYDGSTLRLYVNGAQVASEAASGNLVVSSGALRIGGNNIWGEYFQGRIDDVRVYSRALSATELQTDMNTSATLDTVKPTVTSSSPANGAIDVVVAPTITANFSEAMDPASINTSSVQLLDPSSTPVPANVTYDPITAKATLTPTTALLYNTQYSVKIGGGSTGNRVKDMSGNAPAADITISFTTEPPPPPILAVGDVRNPFSTYTTEMLRAEGLNDFATIDISLLSPSYLNYFDVVILGDMALSPLQVTMLTDWVNNGGNLIALHPDKQLAGLLGLTDAAATLSNAYLQVNTASGPGVGIVGQTMQFHGTADRYTLNGATSLGTLYSNATTATVNPAVTLRDVGVNGGQAAAFTFDLNRSIVYTRQGNPAWAGQERDGVTDSIRPDDLFFGAKSGDVQPDWVDLNKVAIPQADEQQRLLANMITSMIRDRKPLPRFWYMPRGLKAAVVLTGDDHAVGGTAGRFDRYKAESPAGCVVANWECIRSTSYIYPANTAFLTNTQAASYVSQGFEVALHVAIAGTNSLTCQNWTPATLDSIFAARYASFTAAYPSLPPSATERTHCVSWDDWATHAKMDFKYGVKLDTNYYYYPGSWMGTKPGFMTGSGFAQRFADTDGTLIDVYQANTEMTDESGQSYPTTSDALLDKALGPEGYYGFFIANMHTDNAIEASDDALVASAKAHGVPLISAKQMLDWVDGRNNSAFRQFSWTGSTLGFRISVGANTNGLQGMLPMQGPGGKTLTTLTKDGSALAFTTQTVKGVQYGIFTAAAGTYAATYN